MPFSPDIRENALPHISPKSLSGTIWSILTTLDDPATIYIRGVAAVTLGRPIYQQRKELRSPSSLMVVQC